MDFGRESRPVSTVAPVVVSPDIDSKIASVIDIAGVSAKNSGTAPNVPSTVQKDATTRKPSLSRRSWWNLRTGAQIRKPASKVSAKPWTNGSQDCSSKTRLIAIGGNIVRLNIIRSNPRMRSTTVQFIGFTLA